LEYRLQDWLSIKYNVHVHVYVDPVTLLHPFVGEVQRENVSVKTELIPRVTGK